MLFECYWNIFVKIKLYFPILCSEVKCFIVCLIKQGFQHNSFSVGATFCIYYGVLHIAYKGGISSCRILHVLYSCRVFRKICIWICATIHAESKWLRKLCCVLIRMRYWVSWSWTQRTFLCHVRFVAQRIFQNIPHLYIRCGIPHNEIASECALCCRIQRVSNYNSVEHHDVARNAIFYATSAWFVAHNPHAITHILCRKAVISCATWKTEFHT